MCENIYIALFILRIGMDEKTRFMKEAIKLSFEGLKKGGPFGAVIVKKGKIISKGYNKVTASNDPTAHAEIIAIRNACRKLKSFSLKGCDMYTGCEPCPMCLSAIYWARIDNVYFANTTKDAANAGFDDFFIYNEIKCPASKRKIKMKQLMKDEAIKTFQEWKRKKDKIRY